MSNLEFGFPTYVTVLERDVYIHQAELLKLARLVAFEADKDKPVSQNSPREYIYLLIDAAVEAGYTLDFLEAVDLLECGRNKNLNEKEMWDRRIQNTKWISC